MTIRKRAAPPRPSNCYKSPGPRQRLPTRISSPCGKTPTPTSRSSSKLRRNTPSCSNSAKSGGLLERKACAAAAWERHDDDVRALAGDVQSVVARIACRDEEADLLAGVRLIPRHRPPADRVVIPVLSVLGDRPAVLVQPAPI